ncbi:MAG: hydrogenase expression/formation protein HypE [Planctomycetota bacterium]
MDEQIRLDHGEGGAATARLVREVFWRHLGGPPFAEDAAAVEGAKELLLTTDAFVVRPLFFPGGDLGRLSVCGTINDLAVAGAVPLALAAAFVLEEGLEVAVLEHLVASMAAAAGEAGVRIAAGDTKVVGRGEADGVFVTTTGIGRRIAGVRLAPDSCRPGDAILVSGPVGDHGIAVLLAREDLGLRSPVASDCAPVGALARAVLAAAPGTRCMRDPTRGGLATAIVELAAAAGAGAVLHEEAVPVRDAVLAVGDLLGLDPLYVACEGRLIAIVPPVEAAAALAALRRDPAGREAAQIGEIVAGGGVILATAAGGHRPLHALEGAQLPRIC